MHIRLINLNTTASMTAKIGAAGARVAAAGTRVSASNPDAGPVSIESHFDEAISAVGVLEEIRCGGPEGVDAYVIACFGDPGRSNLLAADEELERPQALPRELSRLGRTAGAGSPATGASLIALFAVKPAPTAPRTT